MEVKKVHLVFSFFTFLAVVASPFPQEEIQDSNREAKGVLDILTGGESPTVEGGPKLIVGAFQAIVTKFDPSLVQGMPGVG